MQCRSWATSLSKVGKGRGKERVPYEVEKALLVLGSNLRTARLRRNMTAEDVATRIGVHRTTLSQAEKGDPNVAASTYVAALWIYRLTDQVHDVADPFRDEEGLALEAARARKRARPSSGGMDNDF